MPFSGSRRHDPGGRLLPAGYRNATARFPVIYFLHGLPAGPTGFGAFNIGLRHLETFAAVESWSGYFAATDPTGLRTLDLGSEETNQEAQVPRDDGLDADLEVRPTFIGEQDSRFLTANILLDRAFSAHHIAHRFEIQQAGHSGSLWRKRAPLWLGLALEHLSRPQRVR